MLPALMEPAITTEAILPVCMVTLNFPLNGGAIFYSNALQPQQVKIHCVLKAPLHLAFSSKQNITGGSELYAIP